MLGGGGAELGGSGMLGGGGAELGGGGMLGGGGAELGGGGMLGGGGGDQGGGMGWAHHKVPGVTFPKRLRRARAISAGHQRTRTRPKRFNG
jgi:hypothetical protein